jgi:hypothetical protein
LFFTSQVKLKESGQETGTRNNKKMPKWKNRSKKFYNKTCTLPLHHSDTPRSLHIPINTKPPLTMKIKSMEQREETYLNFGGIEPPFSAMVTSKITIIPVPYDLTTTYVTGTKNGPGAIIEASTHMELYDEELGKETYQVGIYTHKPVAVSDKEPEEMLRIVSETVSSDMKSKKVPVTLGGEHSISVGVVQEMVKVYPNLSVLQLDAHADLRDTYKGTPYNHACVGRRISELWLISRERQRW